MNPIVNATGEDVIGIGLALVGAFFGVLILRALNRKFQIFSRGTVSFMLTVLIIFTAVDTVAIMNSIRNNQSTVRSLADHHTVTSIVQAWIDEGAKLAAHQIDGESNQLTLLADFEAAEEEIESTLDRKNAHAESLDGLKLVSLSVDRYGHMEIGSRRSRRFTFRALLDDGRDYHWLQGGISIRHRGDDKGIGVANFKGSLQESSVGSANQIAYKFYHASSYKSDEYQLDSRRRKLMRLVKLDKDD